MSLNQEIKVHNNYMVVVLNGQFSLAEALALAKEMFEVGSQHKVKKGLVDIRRMTGVPNTIERFQYAQFLADKGLAQKSPGHPIIRLAYLGYAPTLDPTRFGEYVANNRGAMVRSFFDESEAWAWLEIDDKPGESPSA
ncbi:MAG: hypothetical protein IPL78_08675 [Chloroflexi bacterium]|nr:hypothetical protein [Chloroflexota bacterium]